jgi:hypothetical protein
MKPTEKGENKMKRLKYARRSFGLSVMVAALMVAALAVPANAGSFTNRSTEVSCDGVTVKSASSIDHNTNGNVTVKQNNSNPTSNSIVWLRSANGNDTGSRNLSDGETGTWTSVLSSTYTIRVKRSVKFNCNGISFGDGNYVWTYSGTY